MFGLLMDSSVDDDELIVHYEHHGCEVNPYVRWHEVWSCACDGTCTACGMGNIVPVMWHSSHTTCAYC